MKQFLIPFLLVQSLLAGDSVFGLTVGNTLYYEYVNFNDSYTQEVIDTVSIGDTLCAVVKSERLQNGLPSSSLTDTLFELNSVLYSYRNGRVQTLHDLSIPDNDSTFELITFYSEDLDTMWNIKTVSANSFSFLPQFENQINVTFDIHQCSDEEEYFTFIQGVGLVSSRISDGRTDYNLVGAIIDNKPYGEVPSVSSLSPDNVNHKTQQLRITNNKLYLPQNEKFELSLYSVNGQLIRVIKGNSKSIMLSELQLTSGYYIVKAVQGESVFTGDFLIK